MVMGGWEWQLGGVVFSSLFQQGSWLESLYRTLILASGCQHRFLAIIWHGRIDSSGSGTCFQEFTVSFSGWQYRTVVAHLIFVMLISSSIIKSPVDCVAWTWRGVENGSWVKLIQSQLKCGLKNMANINQLIFMWLSNIKKNTQEL